MAATRSFTIFDFKSSFALSKRLFSTSRYRYLPHSLPQSLVFFSNPLTSITLDTSSNRPFSLTTIKTFFPKLFSTSPEVPKRNTRVNFSLSDSDSDADDSPQNSAITSVKEVDKSKLPPPYDPFSKKPVIEEPDDPKNLQEVFHKIRTDGLTNNAVKMFDALSKDGLTHEALELFAQIKDKGSMPDVVAHTAVIEAYANAGQANEALKVYMRMLASGVMPNAYTYTVLIKGLAGSKDAKLLGEARKYLMEMLEKKIRPNAGTYVAVFEAFVKERKEEEGKELLKEMKARGFSPEEKAVREILRDKRGPAFRSVMNILFGK